MTKRPDLNDTLLEEGREAVGKRLDNARRYQGNGRDELNGHDHLTLTPLSEIPARKIRWLWRDYLAVGKITIIGGNPGLGKSQITIDLAARMSRGIHWPLGAEAPIGRTVFLVSEDDAADTIRPRAAAAGADLDRLLIVQSSVRDAKTKKQRLVSLNEDVALLEIALRQYDDTKSIVIDSLSSYMGRIDSNSQSDVRGVMDPVAEMARRTDCCVIGVMHPPKGHYGKAIDAFAGSKAFVAVARIALAVDADPDTPGRNLLLPVKTNIGPMPRAIGYRVVGDCETEISRIVWDDAPVDYTADSARVAHGQRKDDSELERAKDFLRARLANGPVEASSMWERADAEDLAERTVKRAKKALNVKTEKQSGKPDAGWVWRLP